MNLKNNLRIRKLKVWSHKMAYFMGFLAGDGWVSKKRPTAGIKSSDRELIYQFKKWLGYENKVHKQVMNGRKDLFYLKFDREEIYRILLSHNVKSVDIWGRIPEEFFWDFVRGFFDADGCANLNGVYRQASFAQKDRFYLECLKIELQRRGIMCGSISKSKKGQYRFYVRRSWLKSFIWLLYSFKDKSFWLERKRVVLEVKGR